MILIVLVAALTLAQGVSVDASLGLLPILRGNKFLTSGSLRALPGFKGSREILEALPAPAPAAFTTSHGDSLNKNHVIHNVNDDDDDVTENGGQASLPRMTPYYVHSNDSRRTKEAINNIIMELFDQVAEYERRKQFGDRLRQGQEQAVGKRLWGQRRNGPGRIASFGTKLSPSRKMLLGSSGSTLLRYGRSTHQKK